MSLHDLIVDCWDEDVLIEQLKTMDGARLNMDPAKPSEPWFNADDFMTVRLKDVESPEGFARALQRQVQGLRVVGIVDRLAEPASSEMVPGSFVAQRKAGLLGKAPTSPVDW